MLLFCAPRTRGGALALSDHDPEFELITKIIMNPGHLLLGTFLWSHALSTVFGADSVSSVEERNIVLFAPTVSKPTPPPDNMVRIPGGEFSMGQRGKVRRQMFGKASWMVSRSFRYRCNRLR